MSFMEYRRRHATLGHRTSVFVHQRQSEGSQGEFCCATRECAAVARDRRRQTTLCAIGTEQRKHRRHGEITIFILYFSVIRPDAEGKQSIQHPLSAAICESSAGSVACVQCLFTVHSRVLCRCTRTRRAHDWWQ